MARPQGSRNKKGVSRVNRNGYIGVFAPGHPLAASDGYVLEHRMVVHDAGVPIPPGHDVHHINEDTTDNRLENLAVVSHGDHRRIHHAEDGVRNQFGHHAAFKTPAERIAAAADRHGHGARRTYSAGCRCDECIAANRAYNNAWNEARRTPGASACAACSAPLPPGGRSNRIYCSAKCRSTAHAERVASGVQP